MNIKQVSINAFFVIGTLVLAFILWQFREALILFVFSLVVAAAARPYIENLVTRGVSRPIATTLTFLLFLALIFAIFWAVGRNMVLEIQSLSNRLAATYELIWITWPDGTELQQFLITQLPPPEDLYENFSPERAGSLLSGLMGFTSISANFLGQMVTILILSIYWSIDRVHFERLWLSILPVDSRARARDMWRNIERDFGAYIRSEVLQSLFAGLLLGIGLWLLGIQFPILLAIFAALAWLIPWLGGVLAIIPIALTGFSQGLWWGVFATTFAISVLFFLEFYVEPRFFLRRQRQFSSLLSILLIIALSKPFGLLGFLVAPPLAATIELIFRYNLQNRTISESRQASEQILILRRRIAQIREILSQGTEPPEPQIASLLGRLETLVDQTDRALRQQQPGQKVLQPPDQLRI